MTDKAFFQALCHPRGVMPALCYLINVTLVLSTNCAIPRRFIYLLQRLKDSKILHCLIYNSLCFIMLVLWPLLLPLLFFHRHLDL